MKAENTVTKNTMDRRQTDRQWRHYINAVNGSELDLLTFSLKNVTLGRPNIRNKDVGLPVDVSLRLLQRFLLVVLCHSSMFYVVAWWNKRLQLKHAVDVSVGTRVPDWDHSPVVSVESCTRTSTTCPRQTPEDASVVSCHSSSSAWYRSSVFCGCGSVDLEFATWQSSWPSTSIDMFSVSWRHTFLQNIDEVCSVH